MGVFDDPELADSIVNGLVCSAKKDFVKVQIWLGKDDKRSIGFLW